MSAQPTLQPNHKVHRYVTSTVWNTGLAKRCQIYNIFRTNIKIYKKNIDKVNQQGHLQVLYARKPSGISPMPEDFSNGQKGICRLPTVSPLMNSTTEAKLPNQTPDKTFGISASAAMPKDLPLWAERNRKIDALRFTPTAKPPASSNSLRLIIQ